MDVLAQVMATWQVRACIVSPSFATPSGALMPDAARRRLLALADEHDVAVIEDDIYADAALAAVPDSLKSLDGDERVIVCSSFSKTLSRDLRLGWVVGGRWQSQIQRLKLVTQLASSRFVQQGVAEFIADGSYTHHLRRLRSDLRQRRDQLASVLCRWPQAVRASMPEGGLSVWVELPEQVDTLDSYSRALAQGIVLTPGPLFSVSGQFRHCLRLSFAHPWNGRRLDALDALPEVLGMA
jgi:DNA-binding transcriptional MocR family regulator